MVGTRYPVQTESATSSECIRLEKLQCFLVFFTSPTPRGKRACWLFFFSHSTFFTWKTFRAKIWINKSLSAAAASKIHFKFTWSSNGPKFFELWAFSTFLFELEACLGIWKWNFISSLSSFSQLAHFKRAYSVMSQFQLCWVFHELD